MNSAGGNGQSGPNRWLGVGLRLLVTLLFLLLILTLSRCGLLTQPVTATPTLVAASAQLRIEVAPAGATVFVDGLRSGTTPALLTLPPGQHTVRIEQEGYQPLVQPVNLAADSVASIDGELIPLLSASMATVTPVPTQVPIASQPLPDLAVKHIQIELESGGDCDYASTQLGARVVIENAGGADAGPFAVDANGSQQAVPEGLASGQTVSLWFTDYVHDGENTVIVDAASQVEESNEANNTLSQRLPIPTLPPTCTAPPTESAPNANLTATPDPTDLPSKATLAPPQPPPAAVTMHEGQITLPTYPYADFTTQAWSDAFNTPYSVLDWEAYRSSNPVAEDMTYRTFVIENEILQLTFLPEVGGRLYEVVYKPTGHLVTYRNPVLKPSPWGPPEQGWWLAAGGIEWALPVEEHGYEWGKPWKLSASYDGESVTVTMRDNNTEGRIRAEIAVRLEAGVGHFTIRPRIENPTAAPLDVKYWTNAMLAPGGQNAPSADLRFVLPDEVTEVTVHSRGDEFLPAPNESMPWPVFNGTDFGRLGNWNQWLGFFQDPAAGEFVAVYDEGYDEGVVRVSSPGTTPGVKGFAFGWKDPISPETWTDDQSSYVEIHGGPAPTFDDSITIPAGDHLQWTETWYPVAGLGGLRYANGAAALNLAIRADQALVAVGVPRPWNGDLVLLLNGKERWRQGVSLLPGQPLQHQISLGTDVPQTGKLTLRMETPDGTVTAEYSAEFDLK
jgi:hypothetical protein